MSTETSRTPAPRTPIRRTVPPFHPVPVAARHDGWTPARQACFIGALVDTRCVSAAAKAVGKSRASAYRLRERAGGAGFASAWDAALHLGERLPDGQSGGRQARETKVTLPPLDARALEGLIVVRVYRGRFAGYRRICDDAALLRALRTLRKHSRNGAQVAVPDARISARGSADV